MFVKINNPTWLLQQALEVLGAVLGGKQVLHHALLITGPRGGGQRELAHFIAAARLCESRAGNGLACGQCRACRWLGEGSHPDFRWVRPESDQASSGETPARAASSRSPKASREIVIDQIRSLAGFVELASHRGAERVILIDPADAMNAAAANALLKTLEEPPPAVRFLLTSDRPERLAATIRSRCRRLPVRLPAAEQLRGWLSEGVPDAKGASIDAAISAGGGAPFAALAFLQDSGSRARERMAEALATLPEADPIAVAEALAGNEAEPLLRALHAWTVDLGRSLLGAAPVHFATHSDRLRKVAARTDPKGLGRFEQTLLQQLRWAQHPLNARLVIEDILLEYQAIFRARARGAARP